MVALLESSVDDPRIGDAWLICQSYREGLLAFLDTLLDSSTSHDRPTALNTPSVTWIVALVGISGPVYPCACPPGQKGQHDPMRRGPSFVIEDETARRPGSSSRADPGRF